MRVVAEDELVCNDLEKHFGHRLIPDGQHGYAAHPARFMVLQRLARWVAAALHAQDCRIKISKNNSHPGRITPYMCDQGREAGGTETQGSSRGPSCAMLSLPR